MELKYIIGVQAVMNYMEALLQYVCMVYGILHRSLVVMVSTVEQHTLKVIYSKVNVCHRLHMTPYTNVTDMFTTRHTRQSSWCIQDWVL